MELFDTHAHFDDFAAEDCVADILDQARAAQVDRITAIGGNPAANRLALQLAREHGPMLGCACGFDRDQAQENPDMDELRELLAAAECLAVGESGLDYHYQPETASAQKILFERNLELAAEFALPVVVHSRDADEDTIAILQDYANACDPGCASIGVLHCYTRGRAMAGKLLDLGFHISLSGIVTFKNAALLRSVAAYLPEDRIVIETDAPYLAPEPVRGRRNHPALLAHVAECVAAVRSTTVEKLAETTARNARRLFGIETHE